MDIKHLFLALALGLAQPVFAQETPQEQQDQQENTDSTAYRSNKRIAWLCTKMILGAGAPIMQLMIGALFSQKAKESVNHLAHVAVTKDRVAISLCGLFGMVASTTLAIESAIELKKEFDKPRHDLSLDHDDLEFEITE